VLPSGMGSLESRKSLFFDSFLCSSARRLKVKLQTFLEIKIRLVVLPSGMGSFESRKPWPFDAFLMFVSPTPEGETTNFFKEMQS
jgi:hypothetical protein